MSVKHILTTATTTAFAGQALAHTGHGAVAGHVHFPLVAVLLAGALVGAYWILARSLRRQSHARSPSERY